MPCCCVHQCLRFELTSAEAISENNETSAAEDQVPQPISTGSTPPSTTSAPDEGSPDPVASASEEISGVVVSGVFEPGCLPPLPSVELGSPTTRAADEGTTDRVTSNVSEEVSVGPGEPGSLPPLVDGDALSRSRAQDTATLNAGGAARAAARPPRPAPRSARPARAPMRPSARSASTTRTARAPARPSVRANPRTSGRRPPNARYS